MRRFIRSRQVTAVHDISDGGLIAAVAEMALASKGLGARLSAPDHAALFAEDQARYVLTCPAAQATALIGAAQSEGIDLVRIGTVTEEPALIVEGAASISLDELRAAHEGWFPAYMSGQRS